MKKLDDKWYCLNCGKKKEEYEALYCDKCWEEENKREEV